MKNPILAGFLQSADRQLAYELASLMGFPVLTHTDCNISRSTEAFPSKPSRNNR
jgi:hypothetical protein